METDPPRYLLACLPGCLAALAVASTLAILITLLIRRAVRRVFGAAAAYSTWLLVPVAMFAVLLPNWRSLALTSAIHAHEGLDAVGHRILVSAGRSFDVYAAVAGAKYESSCVVRPLKNDLLRINCRLRRNGQVFATPSVMTRDGQRCVTEVAYMDAQGHVRGTRLEITPSIQK